MESFGWSGIPARFGSAVSVPRRAGPVTLGIYVGTIKLVLSHAAAVHGPSVKVEPIDLARIALKRLGRNAIGGRHRTS
jgi:hypothetical protein